MTLKIPQRVSLVTQTVGLLRDAITTGVWGKLLPGEVTLCNELQISRVTLRAALAQLEREGWFTSGRGRRREIIPRKFALAAAPPKTTIVLLSPIPQKNIPANVILQLFALRERLAAVGFELEIVPNSACFSQRPDRALEGLHREFHAACYILYLSTEAMQRWFSAGKINCMVTGSCHPNVKLPSIDIDYAAVCHHAVGRFVAAGRTRLALLMPRSDQAGNLESGRGFLSAGSKMVQSQVHTIVADHGGTVESICRTIDRLIGSPAPFNGLLIAKPSHVITVLSHLLRRGIRIPEDISVISRDDDPVLDNLVPAVGRYQTDPTKFVRKVARIIIDSVESGSFQHRSQRMIPTFIPGQTLS